MSQNASARSRVSGASAATRSTTSRQNSTGKTRVELLAGHGVLGPGRHPAAVTRLREPEPLEVLLGQGHGGVEADDGEVAAPRG